MNGNLRCRTVNPPRFSFFPVLFELDRRQLGRGRGFHCRANILDRHVGVKFRRDGDGAVAEQRLHHFEVSRLAQRARSRGVAQVLDPRVDAGIYPFALVGTDPVVGDRITLALDEFFAGLWARPGALRYECEKVVSRWFWRRHRI
jgi:hypothetical protein